MAFDIQSREQYVVNTDPQRRCYNGCNFSEEKVWSEWLPLGTVKTKEEAEESVARWRAIPMGYRVCEFRFIELKGV